MSKLFLLSGFLGSGKTTLLRNLLAWSGDLSDTAILVNEYGQVGIDGELLAQNSVPVTELANGCICCSMRSDLISSLQEIEGLYRPDRIIIEATGLADPYEIRDILAAEQGTKAMDCKVVTVVSADLWECHDMFGPLFFNQLKAADLLLLNKIDLIEDTAIAAYLYEIRQYNPNCPIETTAHCRISPDIFWQLTPQPGQGAKPLISMGDSSLASYSSFAFVSEMPLKRRCFQDFISNLPAMLHRIKGFARLEDEDVFFDYSNGQSTWRPSEKQENTRLTFIGRDIDKQRMLADLQACQLANCQ